MNIKKTLLFLLSLSAAAQTYAYADLNDSKRCSGHSITMTAAEDGCVQEYCARKAFVCVPRSWWTGTQISIPNNAIAPLVLAFHGKSKKDIDAQELPQGAKDILKFAPEAGMFAVETNLHGKMPTSIVIYFQGLPTFDNWSPAVPPDGPNYVSIANNPYWRGWQVNPGSSISEKRDLTFINKFLKDFIYGESSTFKSHVDLQNIYAVGHSNGSRFVGVLWHNTSVNNFLYTPFKAIAFSAAQAGPFAPTADTFNVTGENLITPSDATSIFMSMGIKDTKVPFTIQQSAIQEAENRLGIDLSLTENAAEDVTGINSTNNSLSLRVIKHNEFKYETVNGKLVEQGHVWPENQEQKIAEFFGLFSQ